jgi:hypothetical protein
MYALRWGFYQPAFASSLVSERLPERLFVALTQDFIMHTSIWLGATAVLGIVGMPTATLASGPAPADQPLGMMAGTAESEPHSTEHLNRLADDINQRISGTDTTTTSITDAFQSPFLDDLLDGLLDEQGELNLPLGLTVYDAMGTTSIGFGTKF